MLEARIDCRAAAYEADMLQIERVVDCLVNIIGEIGGSVQLVCLKSSWVQVFRARGKCQFFRIDISFYRL